MRRYPDFTHLTEANIDNLLSGVPDDELGDTYEHAAMLGPLQEPQLIAAIYHKNYPGIYRRLDKLTKPLSHADAMAACLCALNGSRLLMNRILDHCPPIPQFQFQGVGRFSSLVETAARYEFLSALDVLLSRGADPNRGPGGIEQLSPLESVFFNNSYLSLIRLLQEPTLDLTVTESLLATWGKLKESALWTDDGEFDRSTMHAWACQTLYKSITGSQELFLESVPLLPQLRLRHALMHNNVELAIRLCREHPLDKEDLEQARSFFADHYQLPLLTQHSSEQLISMCAQQTEFLLELLERCPQLLETPELRTAVCCAVLAPSQPDERVQCWAERLKPGPVQLPESMLFLDNLFRLFRGSALDQKFCRRWKRRIPGCVKPTLSRHHQIPRLERSETEQLLELVIFTDQPVPGHLSKAALLALHAAPEHLLPQLMQGDGILAAEDQNELLKTCETLSPGRRNQILPYIKKEVTYDL